MRLAGRANCPGFRELTFGELCDYAEAASERDCALVARLCAVVANARGAERSEDSFNPYYAEETDEEVVDDMSEFIRRTRD